MTRTHRSRIQDGWLPIPAAALEESGFTEGDWVQLEVVGDTLLVTKTEAPPPFQATVPASRGALTLGILRKGLGGVVIVPKS